MKVLNVMAGVCGLAAVLCSCTKNEPVKEPEKEPVAVEEVKLDATEVRVARGGGMPADGNCAPGGRDIRGCSVVIG